MRKFSSVVLKDFPDLWFLLLRCVELTVRVFVPILCVNNIENSMWELILKNRLNVFQLH